MDGERVLSSLRRDYRLLGGEYKRPPEEKGLLVESVCADHMKRLAFNIEGSKENVYFWDYPQGEVDLVINIADKTVPIEVKYRDTVSKNNLKGLNRFFYDNDADYGIMITKNKTGIEEVREEKLCSSLYGLSL